MTVLERSHQRSQIGTTRGDGEVDVVLRTPSMATIAAISVCRGLQGFDSHAYQKVLPASLNSS